MLVVTRKVGESVVIDNDVVVTVVRVKGDRVRIGVTAPSDVPVDREEVHNRKLEQVEDDVEADLKELQGDKEAIF